jgi:hypothetical protein
MLAFDRLAVCFVRIAADSEKIVDLQALPSRSRLLAALWAYRTSDRSSKRTFRTQVPDEALDVGKGFAIPRSRSLKNWYLRRFMVRLATNESCFFRIF